ncbi:AMP-binding protein [Streptomyces sp. NBC_01304]|uniref:AMP-binding protein n=1 Tax=Streptomyces sp. NBC_01304 TaxID=2903818 RepID=UPI002E0E8E5D|nr:AMP-binding protein [Streptomyces sp. NBC_01304]
MTDQPTLYERFAASAAEFGDRTALEVGGSRLTYAELRALADRTAARLVAALDGRVPARVGILAGRSVAAYASYLAAQRIGAAAVPLGVDQAPQRLAVIAADAGLDVAIAEEVRQLPVPVVQFTTDGDVDAGLELPAHRPDPDSVAYIVFTSGSTGTPKGVPILQRNASATLDHALDRYDIGPDARVSGTFDLTFDPAAWDMFTAWSAGAALVVPGRGELVRPARFIAGRGITHWFSVPSVITYAQRLGDLTAGGMPQLRWTLFGGEPLTVRQAAAWREAAPAAVLENLYGPTEVTISCAQFRLPDDPRRWPKTANGTVPIGTVYPRLDFLVLDESGAPSEEGELCVRGPQRFPGYLRPEENAGRFVRFDGRVATPYEDAAPPGDEVYYRTGDRVRAQGEALVHLGRLDHQVKIRGHRIELGEVEAALRALPGVEEAVVVPVADAHGQTGLAAAYTGIAQDPSLVRAELAERVPGYMVPRGLTRVDDLPLNANRKIDRRAVAARLSTAGEGRAGVGA